MKIKMFKDFKKITAGCHLAHKQHISCRTFRLDNVAGYQLDTANGSVCQLLVWYTRSNKRDYVQSQKHCPDALHFCSLCLADKIKELTHHYNNIDSISGLSGRISQEVRVTARLHLFLTLLFLAL